jgi:hypothetical protein
VDWPEDQVMLLAIALSFLAGLLAGNGIPHFVRGITKESYPMVFGSTPVPNLIAGWLSLVLAVVVTYVGRLTEFPIASTVGAAIGLLCIGLYHAGPGALGKK